MRFRSGLIITVIIVLSGYSCKEKGAKNIDQGEIHYSIEYMGMEDVVPRDYMPKTLIVSFKDDKILFEIAAPFGNAGIYNLYNPEEGINDTYLSLLSLKYYYSSKPGELQPGFDAMDGMEIRKTNETAVICGFNCKKGEVTFPADREVKYSIWYTDEIDIKHPNASTPFNEVDGVLMSFFFFLGPAELRFTAETVYKKEISDKIFERRDKYLQVSREEINNFINKMLNLFVG